MQGGEFIFIEYFAAYSHFIAYICKTNELPYA